MTAYGVPDWRAEFADGFGRIVLELDPSGRLRISGFHGEELVHCTMHGRAAIRDMARVLAAWADEQGRCAPPSEPDPWLNYQENEPDWNAA